jgi:hypothetical protein
MGLTVLQRPNQNNSWVAGFNPVLYKMQRKDYTITAVANSAGALQITVSTNLTTLAANKGGPVVVGSVLWVTTDNGVYNAAYTVVSVTNAASSVVTFGASTYTSAATTGYINLAQRTGYQVVTEIYAANGTAPSTGALFTMKFTPSRSGLLTMDVSTLRNYLQPEVSSYLSTITNILNGYKVRANTVSNYQFYIKYTETWVSSAGTASAETQTDDTANRCYIVIAARQIGDLYGGYLKEYSDATGRKFLTRNTAPIIWPGRKFTLSFIDPNPSSTSRTHVKKTRYNADGTVWGATYDLSDAAAAVGNVFESHEDCKSEYNLIYDRQAVSADVDWTNVGVGLSPALSVAVAAGEVLYAPLNVKPNQSVTVSVNVTLNSGTSGQMSIAIRRYSATAYEGVTSAQLITTGTNTYTFTVSDTNELFWLSIFCTSGGTQSITVNSWTVTIPVVNKIDYQLVTLTTPASFPTTETVVSETLTCPIRDLGDNPIQLFWKNHLGGDATFVFDYSQQLSSKIASSRKNRRYLCFAERVTLSQLEAVDELNGTGEIYEPALVELTSTLNKLQGRNGQQVYMVDASGNKTGVIVIPTELRTRTRQVVHNAEIVIELPETIHPS